MISFTIAKYTGHTMVKYVKREDDIPSFKFSLGSDGKWEVQEV
jgi:hypothetical protein